MGDVAQSARDVDYLMNLTWHRFTHRGKDGLGRFLRRPRTITVAGGISVAHQEVVIDVDAPSADDPILGLRAAATAAQLGLPLSLDSSLLLSRSIKEGYGVLPNPWPRQAREYLVSLIGAGHAMVQVWEALDQEGSSRHGCRSGAQCAACHSAIFCIAIPLIATWWKRLCMPAALTRRVHRPDLLLIAALFHDIGKGHTEDHSDRGGRLIEPLARRIGFGDSDVETLKILVQASFAALGYCNQARPR